MLGRTAEAVAEHERAGLEAGHRMPYERARAHAGLAAALAGSDPARAAAERAAAVAEFTAMGLTPDAVAGVCPPLPPSA
jgi:hypothetical protein